jgi:hypothetical protein
VSNTFAAARAAFSKRKMTDYATATATAAAAATTSSSSSSASHFRPTVRQSKLATSQESQLSPENIYALQTATAFLLTLPVALLLEPSGLARVLSDRACWVNTAKVGAHTPIHIIHLTLTRTLYLLVIPLTLMYIHIHAYVHTYIHTYIHAHMCTRTSSPDCCSTSTMSSALKS